MKKKKLIDIVEELNEEIYNKGWKGNEQLTLFVLSSTGYVEHITFGDYVLWNSAVDKTDYDYESIKAYIKVKFNDYVNKLYTMRFTYCIDLKN